MTFKLHHVTPSKSGATLAPYCVLCDCMETYKPYTSAAIIPFSFMVMQLLTAIICMHVYLHINSHNLYRSDVHVRPIRKKMCTSVL